MKQPSSQSRTTRRHLTPKEKAEIVREHRGSGLSLLAFAGKHGRCYRSLLRWRCRQGNGANVLVPPDTQADPRRNWLHVGQEAAGEKDANLFSLMITCKRLGVESYAYLHDVRRRLPSHPNKDLCQLTPRGWKDPFAPTSPPPSPSG